MQKENLKGKTQEELEAFVNRYGEPDFRGRQLMQWIYKGSTDFWKMSDLNAPLREKLNKVASVSQIKIAGKEISTDGTVKYLLELADGEYIESVLIPTEKRNTLCISTQVGCDLSCQFCATGQSGFKRNLSSAEIVDQVLQIKLDIEKELTNLVLMGMGEPLLNFDNLLRALSIFNSTLGFELSARKTTISTIGIPEKIMRLADLGLKNRLAISLNSADESIRNKIMPYTKQYPLNTLVEPIKKYADVSARWVTLEYIMFKGLNSSLSDASKLIEFARELPVKVNFIQYNPVTGLDFAPAPKGDVYKFQAYLLQNQITATIRESRGQDINAACGQLAKINK